MIDQMVEYVQQYKDIILGTYTKSFYLEFNYSVEKRDVNFVLKLEVFKHDEKINKHIEATVIDKVTRQIKDNQHHILRPGMIASSVILQYKHDKANVRFLMGPANFR